MVKSVESSPNVTESSGASNRNSGEGSITQRQAINSSIKKRKSKTPRRALTRRDLSEIKFDTSSPLLGNAWHSQATTVVCLNAYPNGITVSLHERKPEGRGSNNHAVDNKFSVDDELWYPESFQLRLRDTREFRLPKGKYYLYRDSIRQALQKHLSQLHQAGKLYNSVIYFGTVTDPFLSFRKKFDVTMACFEVLEKFKPAKLVVQTRSPMVISALPALKKLEERSVVSMPVETILEESVKTYTPGQPTISERFVAANGLRRQGIKVNFQVAPVLPYGDFYKDSWKFAELLDLYCDHVTFGSLALGRKEEERLLKQLPLCQKLARDKKYHFLRPYSFRNIFKAMQDFAPSKLELPVISDRDSRQMNMFAA